MNSSDIEKTLLRVLVALLTFLSGMFVFSATKEIISGNWPGGLTYAALALLVGAGAGLWVYLLRDLRYE